MRATRASPTRGRQAEARRNDKTVLEAARDVFATEGADAPISAVAERAGVGIGSLYRRYGSKQELLQHLCLLAMEETTAIARDCLAGPDPWIGLSSYVRRCVAVRTGALGPLAGKVEVTAAMLKAARSSLRLLTELLARAQRAGSVRDDLSPLDIAWLIELFGKRPMDETPTERVLAIALAGLRADASEPLPGPRPSVKKYEGRWTSP